MKVNQDHLNEHLVVDKLVNDKDHESFTILYERYKPRIDSLIARYIKDHNDREEVSQDIWLKIYAKAHQFRGNSLFLTWVYRCAVNQCLNQIKYQQRKPLWLQHDLHRLSQHDEDGSKEDPVNNLKIDGISPEDEVEAGHKAFLFNQTMSELSPELQQSFEMHLEGMENKDIANDLEILEVTHRGRMLRVRLAYKNVLEMIDKEAELSLADFCNYLLELEAERAAEGIGRGFRYMKSLPDDYIEAFLMASNGVSYKEIGEWFGWDDEKVANILIEIRDNLKQLIKIHVG
jgi:RNA polymerase sigma-70 factor (ECF subfamily)